MIWLLVSIILLIALIFLRVDILLVAPIVSVFLCLVSGLNVVDTLAEGFMPAFATFAKNNFLIFMTSAMFARAMQDTGMAASIAHGISSKLGPKYAIPCVFFVSALLTYGGVSLFVVVFVVYPIALQLFKEANITRIIIPGAIAAGAFTWSAFCLPGSPQAGPIVATQNLGTNLMVLPWLGVVCAIFMCTMQVIFMSYLHKSAVKKGLGFEADEKTEELIHHLSTLKLPNFFVSLVPMLVVLITLNVIGLTVYYSMILGVLAALALAYLRPYQHLCRERLRRCCQADSGLCTARSGFHRSHTHVPAGRPRRGYHPHCGRLRFRYRRYNRCSVYNGPHLSRYGRQRRHDAPRCISGLLRS